MGTRNLFLIRGLPGAGKTTLAKNLARRGDCVVAADDFMVDSQGRYRFDEKRLPGAHQKCLKQVVRAMRKGASRVFVHNTFSTEAELKPYVLLARKYRYRAFTLIVENRHKGKSSKAPRRVVLGMRRRFSIVL